MKASLYLNCARRLKGGTCPVYLRVYDGRYRYISLGIGMTETDFKAATSRRVPAHLQQRAATFRQILHRAEDILLQLGPDYTWARFKEQWHGKTGEGRFLHHWLEKKLQDPKVGHGTKRGYRTAYGALAKFWNAKQIDVQDITPYKLEQFEAWIRKQGSGSNTVRNYTKQLRHLLGMAHRAGYLQEIPFGQGKYQQPGGTARNEYLTAEEMAAIYKYQGKSKPHRFARDMFILMYYLYGVNMKDLFEMKGENVQGSALTFRRSKTGSAVVIPLEEDAIEIINRYGNLDAGRDEYILRFLRPGMDDRQIINRVGAIGRRIREGIKEVAREVGVKDPERVTPAILRQTVRTLLSGAPEGLLNLVMGTSSEVAQKHYLKASEPQMKEMGSRLRVIRETG